MYGNGLYLQHGAISTHILCIHAGNSSSTADDLLLVNTGYEPARTQFIWTRGWQTTILPSKIALAHIKT